MHGDNLLKTLSGVDDASVGGLGAKSSCSNAARCSLPCEYSHIRFRFMKVIFCHKQILDRCCTAFFHLEEALLRAHRFVYKLLWVIARKWRYHDLRAGS